MKLNKLFILGFALTAALFTSCNNNEDDSTNVVNADTEYKYDLGKDVNRAFKGLIVDENNQPLSGVSVKMSGKTTTTNASGVFTLSNVPVKERFAYLTAEKAGYLNGSRTLTTHESLNSLKIMMVKPTVYTIQSGVTSTVSHENTSIKFDGEFVTENGQAYTGSVKVQIVDLPSSDAEVFNKMPGTLLAINTQGEYRGLETYGMVNVEMFGSNNQKLQLASGHKAEITMGISSVKASYAPQTMPLWWFDEAAGVWKEEGFSTKVGNKYVGNVSHFTWWNNDYAYTVATLVVIARNYDNTIAQGVRCTITRQAGSSGDVLMELGVTGANGTLSVGVPRNEVLMFRAYDADGVLVHDEELPASWAMSRIVNVTIPVNNRP